MGNRILSRLAVMSLAFMIFALVGCGDGELQWETTRDAVGAMEGDQAQTDIRWRDYRVGVVQSLDQMQIVLEGARKQLAVGERTRVDVFNDRIATLRHDMLAEMDQPRDGAREIRAGLEMEFQELRNDVDTLLTRIGFDREELARWQDIK